MKVLLATLNSKFIHSSLALRYLREYCSDKPVDIALREFTINDSMHTVMGEVFREKPDVVAFSCYIWNITGTFTLARRIKQVMRDIVIILGGPEVSFDDLNLMEQHPFVDFIVRGEGEQTFREWLEYMAEGKKGPEGIPGLTFRAKGRIVQNAARGLLRDLSCIPFPYQRDSGLENKIVYYEASRGCPYRCCYCLSSTAPGVRYFPVQRVKEDLDRLISIGVRQVKFVDRTFNCNPAFSREIISHLIQKGGDTNFHFEISADLLDEGFIELLASAPPGLFQFEVGVQTTNPEVLREIRRSTRQEVLFQNVRKVSEGKNIHQHLDLIAGLPLEDMASFERSFNDVFSLEPDMLQLGFLKLLKGSGIRDRAKEYGYVFTNEPPYEVLSNNWMDYGDIRRLKLMEEVLEYFYNSHGFDNTLKFLLHYTCIGPFEFFKRLSEYWEERGLHLEKHSRKDLYTLLYEYCVRCIGAPAAVVNEVMKLDFLSVEKSPVLPLPITRMETPSFKQRCFDFLKNPENIKAYLPGYLGLPAKQVYKMVHFEAFDPCAAEYLPKPSGTGGGGGAHLTLLFDYDDRDKLRGKARIIVVDI
jgi:radical SAM superfamily enzyme YgiQ (UPF0313 family)